MTWQTEPPDFAACDVTEEHSRYFWVCNRDRDSESENSMFVVRVHKWSEQQRSGFAFDIFDNEAASFAPDQPYLLWWSEPLAEPPFPGGEG